MTESIKRERKKGFIPAARRAFKALGIPAKELTAAQFNKCVFAGAGTATLRGPSDAFTQQELLELATSDQFASWKNYDKDFVRAAID